MPRRGYSGWSEYTFRRARALWRNDSRTQLRHELNRILMQLGNRGVKIAKTLAPYRTGRLRNSIVVIPNQTRYGLEVRIGPNLVGKTREQAIAAWVAEFGRGHGPRGSFARGQLTGRRYLRASREIVRKNASRRIQGAMRKHARKVLS